VEFLQLPTANETFMTAPHLRRQITMIATLLCILAGSAFAQISEEQRMQLLVEADMLEERSERERSEAEALARIMDIPVRQVFGDGTVIELQRFRDGMPEYYITENSVSAATISSDKTWPGGTLGLSLSGAGVTLSVWDGGAVRTTHQEFGGRVVQRDNAGSLSDHATHVSGTMVAAGVRSEARGMSREAQLQAHDWNNDLSEMTARAAEGIQVSNHSYGSISGWRYNYRKDSRWAWFGDPRDNSPEDRKFGFYDSRARAWDNLVYNAMYFLPVKSAGNDRGEGPSSQPLQHWEMVNGSWTLVSTVREKDGGDDGYDCITTYGNAKNILTVGAVEDIPGGYSTSNDVRVTSFSGWGPSDDGRVKPDIVANGRTLFSALRSSNSAYASYSGTSMSAPSVSGSIGLLLEHQKNLHGTQRLRASTIKGLILHTADAAGNSPGPDYRFGWGLMNTASAAKLMSQHAEGSSANLIREVDVRQDEVYEFELYSAGRGQMKVTICWTDPPGTVPPGKVDPTELMLVNDMDLRVISPLGTEHSPWILDPANPSAPATMGDNVRDNIEQVYIASPEEGYYTVRVSHKGTVQGGLQVVSIIVSVSNAPSLMSPPNGLEALSVSPALQWHAARGGESYDIMVAESPDFKNPVIDQRGLAETWYDAAGLERLTRYYWRVRVHDQSGVSDWSDIWSFETGGALSLAGHALYFDGADDVVEVPHRPGMGQIEQDDMLTVEAWVRILGWSDEVFPLADKHDAASGNGWSLRLHERNGIEFISTAAGTVRANFSPQPGRWYHVAASYDRGEGKIRFYVDGSRRGEVDYDGEIPHTDTAPLYVGYGPTGRGEYAHGVIDEFRVWSTARSQNEINAGMYSIYDGTQNGLAATLRFDEGRMLHTASLPGSVFADLANGPAWLVSDVPIVIPDPPVPVFPGRNSANIPVQAEFRWLPATSATEYRVQISDDIEFRNLLLDARDVRDTRRLAPVLQAESGYFWRVNATNPVGTSDWSDIHPFTTAIAPPDVPTLVSPRKEAVDQPVEVILLWDVPARALRYHVQVSTDSLFDGAFLLDREDYQSPTAVVRDLGNFQDYYWRVRAINFGGIGGWSDRWTFRTLPAAPEAPVLLTPVNDSTGIPSSTQFTWESVPSAERYQFQLSEDGNFLTTLLDVSDIPLTRYAANNLQGATWHYWRVRADNAAGTGPWSPVNRFRTVRPAPARVRLTTPADGAVDVSERPEFTWEADSLADEYTLQVARDDGFTDLVLDVKKIFSNRLRSPQSLPNDTRLYWRVAAANESGSGPLSETWSFTTLDSLAAPLLIAPPDGSMQAAKGIAFRWHAVNAADGYELEVIGPSGGSDGTQADTTAVRDLEDATTYSWRVRAWRGPIAGPWSVEWTFATELPLPGVVTLLEPIEDDEAIDNPQLFRWTATGPQVDRYHFEYAFDDQFQNDVYRDSSITATEVLVSIEPAVDADFWWRVRAGNTSGWGPWSSSRRNRSIVTDITVLHAAAAAGALSPVYPNPFGSAPATVNYTLARPATVTLEVRDMLGRRITVLDEGHRDAGNHRFILASANLPAGQYMLLLRAGDELHTRTMIVLR
jgi:hypothetical protein